MVDPIRWTFVSGWCRRLKNRLVAPPGSGALWDRHQDGDRLASPVPRDGQHGGQPMAAAGRRRSLVSIESGCSSVVGGRTSRCEVWSPSWPSAA